MRSRLWRSWRPARWTRPKPGPRPCGAATTRCAAVIPWSLGSRGRDGSRARAARAARAPEEAAALDGFWMFLEDVEDVDDVDDVVCRVK